jgi:DNA-binding CsgD family transcriptional regulator
VEGGFVGERLTSVALQNGNEQVIYTLLRDGQGFSCERNNTLPDRSQVRMSLPFLNVATLRDFLDADADISPFRARLRPLIERAVESGALVGDGPGEQRGLLRSVADTLALEHAAELLSDCDSLTAAHSLLLGVARFVGMDGYAAVCGELAPDRRIDLHWLIGARPALWQLHMRRHWYLNSALLHEARTRGEPVFGIDVPPVTEGQRAMQRAANAYGVHSIAVFPHLPAHRTSESTFGALLLFGATEPTLGEATARRYAATLHTLAAAFFDGWAARARRERARNAALSQTEVQLLQCLQEKLSAAEAAARLHLSESTIHHHYRRINAKFAVSSKHDALSIALEFGLLGPSPLADS